MIELTDIRHRILDIPSLSLPEGVTTVLGRNGAGKTTLLSLCAGVALPERGVVEIEDTPPRQLEIGWVSEFPDRNILFDSVFDEISAPLRFRRCTNDEITRRTREIIERFSLDHLTGRRTRTLSGGEKVLVSLATALVTDPVLLVIDEADSHLDRATAENLQEMIRISPPRYLLQSTQFTGTASGSDHLVIMEKGRATVELIWE